MALQIREMEKSDWEIVSYIYQQGMDTNIATFECPEYEKFSYSLSVVSSRCVYGGIKIFLKEKFKDGNKENRHKMRVQ